MTAIATATTRSTLADISDTLMDIGLNLRRSWPRDEDHLLLDAVGPGGCLAGQWFASVERAERVTAKTPGAQRWGRVVLQPGGADRALPTLVQVLSDAGAVLVAHRPER